MFGLTEAELDSLPESMQVPKRGGIVRQRPDPLRADYLMLQDLAEVVLIRENLGKRPIYFTWSDGGYPDQTLGPERLPRHPGHGPEADADAGPAHRDGALVTTRARPMDYPRTDNLLWNVYHWKTATRPRPRGWVDPPSASILQLYCGGLRRIGAGVRAGG